MSLLTDRARLAEWLETLTVRKAIIAIILFNALILGFETSPTIMSQWGSVLGVLDNLCLAFFVLELLVKFYAFGARFFRDPWNWIDMFIVGVALLPSQGTLSVLRALRILRLLRVITATPRLRRVVEGFISALPGMASVFLLMGLIFYISAVISTKLFADSHPDWFGTIGRSAYSLFQIMTLESWSMGIVRPVMEVHPYAWAFFVPFIIVTTFAVVNLLVGLIVNSMQDAHHEEDVKNTDAYRDEVLGRLGAIEETLRRLDHSESQPGQ
ncbi:MAG: ion transporter [Pseudomonadota bacterium]